MFYLILGAYENTHFVGHVLASFAAAPYLPLCLEPRAALENPDGFAFQKWRLPQALGTTRRRHHVDSEALASTHRGASIQYTTVQRRHLKRCCCSLCLRFLVIEIRSARLLVCNRTVQPSDRQRLMMFFPHVSSLRC